MATLTDKHLELLRDKNSPTNRVIVRVRPERVFDYGVSDPSL